MDMILFRALIGYRFSWSKLIIKCIYIYIYLRFSPYKSSIDLRNCSSIIRTMILLIDVGKLV